MRRFQNATWLHPLKTIIALLLAALLSALVTLLSSLSSLCTPLFSFVRPYIHSWINVVKTLDLNRYVFHFVKHLKTYTLPSGSYYVRHDSNRFIIKE